MITKLSLAILVLAVGILLFWSWNERPGGRAKEQAKSGVAATPESARLVPPLAPSETATASPREEIPSATAVVEKPARAPEAALAPKDRFRLRGTLLHSSDHRPAGGAALFFHYGEESTRVVTDAAGRFETDPVVPRGAVRAWHQGDARQPDHAEHLEIEPGTFLPEAGSDGELAEVVLLLVDPAAWFEIEVVATNGAPTAAELHWSFRPHEVSEASWARCGRSPTDERGHARLPFPRAEPGARMALLACGADGLVSDVVVVQEPLADGPIRLVLDVGGGIRARVIDADGRPLEGKRLGLGDEDQLIGILFDGENTDVAGFATFKGVSPGRYQVSFWHDETSDWIGAGVEVERGRLAEVELAVPVLPLAVSGRVLDENGLPLEEIRIVASFDDHSTTTSTHQGGAFSVACLGSGSVRVSTEPDISSDRYEPAAIEVPFGTSGLEIRRLAARPTTSLTLEILERSTLERIPDAMVLGFVEPLRENWSFHRAPEGLVTLALKLHEDVCFSVEAVGHRRRELRALDLVRAGPEGGTYRVLLEPGLERSLRILDDEDDEPLVGARVFDGERLVATADGDGRAVIDLGTWPVELRIQAEHHMESHWSSKNWLSELGDGWVWLERAPEDTAGD